MSAKSLLTRHAILIENHSQLELFEQLICIALLPIV